MKNAFDDFVKNHIPVWSTWKKQQRFFLFIVRTECSQDAFDKGAGVLTWQKARHKDAECCETWLWNRMLLEAAQKHIQGYTGSSCILSPE